MFARRIDWHNRCEGLATAVRVRSVGMLAAERFGLSWTAERDCELLRLRHARWPWCRICSELGVTEAAVRRRALELGLPTGRLPWQRPRRAVGLKAR